MNSYCTVLENEALLHIEGPDSLKFLQGQTTCDTRKLDGTRALLGAYCTVKGRVVCDFLLAQISDQHFVLRLRRDILATSAATLAKYIIFSKAKLDTERADWQVFSCWGAQAKQHLTQALGDAPSARHGSVSGDGYVVVQLDEQGLAFECYINTETHPSIAAALNTHLLPGEPKNWQALQINQGQARLEAATVEEFIPQMLNYDLSGHISFDKGCYTGQEVVARMHYRGTPKRRLYKAVLPAGHKAAAGDLLYSSGSTQSTGTVVNCVPAAEPANALVVATVANAGEGFHLHAEDGPLLHCEPVDPEGQVNADP